MSLVVSVLLCEVVVRAFHLAPEIRRMSVQVDKTAYKLSSNPILAYEFKKNYRDATPDLWQTFPYINAQGQRDVERARQKPEGVYRILMLGDSVVCGDGILDLNDTLSRQLEMQFAGHRPPVEVLNFGVSGYCTRSEIELLKTKGLAYAPDMVLVVFTQNDYENHNGFNPFAFPRPPIVNALFVHSALVRYLSLTLNLFQFRAQMDPSYVVEWHGGAIGRNNVFAGMQLLHELSRQHGFKTLILLWPSFEKTGIRHPPGYEKALVRPGELTSVEAICAHFHLPVRRLDTVFSRDWKKHGQGTAPHTFYTIGDSMHPSPQGTKAGAKLIKDLLHLQLPQ